MSKFLQGFEGCDLLFTNGTYFLAGGKFLWLFDKSGYLISKYKDIRYPKRVVFFGDNTALIDGAVDKAFHHVSLDSADILWSSTKKGRRQRETKFAVSPDGLIVYTAFFLKNVLYVECISPHKKLHNRYMIEGKVGVIHDLFCGSDGQLYILHGWLKPKDEDYCPAEKTITHLYHILSISFSEDGCHCSHLREWEMTGRAWPRGFNGTKILQEDYTIVDLLTGEKYLLIPQSDIDPLPQNDGMRWNYEPERKLLTVQYLRTPLNIVIDCVERKIVAKYHFPDYPHGFFGRLVEDTFWIPFEEGIVKKAFPDNRTG